jgi:hypothetical protein
MATIFTQQRTMELLIQERSAAYAPRAEDCEGAALVAEALHEIRARWAPRMDRRRLVAPAAPAAPPAA